MINFIFTLLLAVTVQSISMTPFEADGLWGYKDDAGYPVIEARFRLAGEFSPEGIAAVVDDEGWAYINRSGKVVIRPYIYDNGPDYFSEGLSRFLENGRMGFFDRYGRPVIQPRFDFAFPFSEGLAAVCNGCVAVSKGEHSVIEGGAWGYIDSKGSVVIPLRYEHAGPFRNGTAGVKRDGKDILIDNKGDEIRPGTLRK